MHKIFFLLIMFSWGFNVLAQTSSMNCENVLTRLETGETNDVLLYDKCGFNDEKVVWNKWAAYASENKMKKALYQICVRFPKHVYHELYCEKSAQLGYGPALAVLGKIAFSSDDRQKGMQYFIQALETKELSQEEEGEIAEILGVYYLRNEGQKAIPYLKTAALKRSALANNIMGYLTFTEKNQSDENNKEAFKYFWRGILLGCSSAEENLGLFQLTRLKKITKEMASDQMKKNLYSCTPVWGDIEIKTDEVELAYCQCKSVLEKEKRFEAKPYLLIKTDSKGALLRLKDNKEIFVSEKDNLPDGGRVDQVRKTAVILMYPNNRREVLNMYIPDKCVSFCRHNQISENLSAGDMQKRTNGFPNVKIKPYHLSFTEQECDVIRYYAPALVDVNKPYVGKEKCSMNGKGVNDPVLERFSPVETAYVSESEKISNKSDEIDETLSIKAKQKLQRLGENLIRE